MTVKDLIYFLQLQPPDRRVVMDLHNSEYMWDVRSCLLMDIEKCGVGWEDVSGNFKYKEGEIERAVVLRNTPFLKQ